MAPHATTALALALAVLSAGPVLAAAAPAVLVVDDVAGDANGVNDQGEGLVGDRSGPPSSREADLRALRFAPVEGGGRTTGVALLLTTTEPFGAQRSTGADLSLGAVVHVTSDCLFAVEVTSRDGGAVEAVLTRGGCGAEGPAALAVEQAGRTLRVDVPYDLLPAEAAPGTAVRDVRLHARLALGHGLSAVELDGAHGGQGARLPR